MNKECGNDLEIVKEQNYGLFLHNLLDWEERAHRKVKKIYFKYFDRGGTKGMEKKEANEIVRTVVMAGKIGNAAGRKKLRELAGDGYKWKVVDESNQKVVGHLLDVCGFASLSIPGRGRIVRAFKKIGEYNGRMDGYEVRGIRIWKKFGPSGYCLSLVSTGRQEMSVNEAAVEAASDYLNENHLECGWDSVID